MKVVTIAWILLLCGFAEAGETAVPQAVTVPAVIDHNRIVIEAALPLLNGSMQRVRAWVDNGDPDLNLSRKIATQLGLTVACNDRECSSPPPPAIIIGEMTIPLTDVKIAKIPLKPVDLAPVLAAGMNADINLPASVLRHYDILIDFPGHKFSIGSPGSIHFLGSSSKVEINAENGLIQVPSRIENKKYNLALDLGLSISLLSEELFDSLAKEHTDWPHMTGAVGSANLWGADMEAMWKVMRLDRVQYGPLFLTDVAVVSLPKTAVDFFAQRAGMPTVGSLGSDVFLSYRVGLDYAHSTVYFDIGRFFKFPDFDVVGLVLRPEDDGRYTVLGVPDFEGKPAVEGILPRDRLIAVNDIPVTGATMGQVWSMLGGTPGQERKLTIERGGKQFAVAAEVQHFLPEVPDSNKKRK
jgi:hypothetical protein